MIVWKTMQTWLGGKSCFSHTNASNFFRPLQSLLLRYTTENSQVTYYFDMLVQLILTKVFKSELLSYLPKVGHVTKSCKEPIQNLAKTYKTLFGFINFPKKHTLAIVSLSLLRTWYWTRWSIYGVSWSGSKKGHCR